MTNNEILNGLELAIELENKRDGTRQRYTSDIQKMMDFFEDKGSIANLSDDDIRIYALYLHHQGYAASTYNGHIAAIKYVYRHVIFREVNKYKVPYKKLDSKQHPMPNTQELKLILDNCKNLEIKCCLLLAACSGLRISEIARVKISEINSKANELVVIGKGNKLRYTVLPKEVIIVLRKYYLSEREKIEGNEYLFAQKNHKGHIKSDYIGREMRRAVNKAGTINYTIHGLRRYFATTVYMQIKDIDCIANYMGHDSVETTKKYIDLPKLIYEIKTPIAEFITKDIVANGTNTKNN